MTPEQRRDDLLRKLDDQQRRVTRLEGYYEGRHPTPTPPRRLNARAFEEARRAFSHLAKLGVTNWVKLVADAPSERLAVVGFRFGEDVAGDQDAWRIWQQNQLDADQALVHDNALQTGQSYALVWADEDGQPLITPEHSSQMVVAYVPGSRRKRMAALKSWTDEDGRGLCTLYTPTDIFKWQTKSTTPGLGFANGDLGWEPRLVDGETWPLPNALGVVPVVEFSANRSLRPSMYGGGMAEYESVIPIQDRINKTVFDRLVTAEHQAFRQRWAIGWDPPRNDAGEVDQAAMQRASQSSLWTFDMDPSEIKLGEFDQADFGGFLAAVEADVNAMAAISKTPPQYLLGAMVNISGDALVAAESGLVSKTQKHQMNFAESWEEVMRLALRVTDDPRANDLQSMIIWRDAEMRNMAQTVDAVLKMKQLGVPTEALWQMLPGVTPQDINRWRGQAMLDLMLEAPVADDAPTPPA